MKRVAIGIYLVLGMHWDVANAQEARNADISNASGLRGEFLSAWNEIRLDFSRHIARAKNIQIPTVEKEFPWKINWKSNRKYCQALAKKIFGQDQYPVETPLPDAAPLLIGKEKTVSAIRRSFPKCDRKNAKKSTGIWELVFHETRWDTHSKANFLSGYFVGVNHLVAFEYIKDESTSFPLTYWTAGFSSQESCPTYAKSGPNFYPFEHKDLRKTIFLRIDGEIVPAEYGAYSTSINTQNYGTRWGTYGQKFILIKSLKHDLWRDWVSGGHEVAKEAGAFEDENSTSSTLQAACVFNFEN